MYTIRVLTADGFNFDMLIPEAVKIVAVQLSAHHDLIGDWSVRNMNGEGLWRHESNSNAGDADASSDDSSTSPTTGNESTEHHSLFELAIKRLDSALIRSEIWRDDGGNPESILLDLMNAVDTFLESRGVADAYEQETKLPATDIHPFED